LAPKQLVSVGLESKQGEYYFKKVHNFSTVDYATTHCWVQNWGESILFEDSVVGRLADVTFLTSRHLRHV